MFRFLASPAGVELVAWTQVSLQQGGDITVSGRKLRDIFAHSREIERDSEHRGDGYPRVPAEAGSPSRLPIPPNRAIGD